MRKVILHQYGRFGTNKNTYTGVYKVFHNRKSHVLMVDIRYDSPYPNQTRASVQIWMPDRGWTPVTGIQGYLFKDYVPECELHVVYSIHTFYQKAIDKMMDRASQIVYGVEEVKWEE